MKKLDELSFTEAQAMYNYALLKASQYEANQMYDHNTDGAKWRKYAEELEESFELKIRAALGK